MSEKYVYIRARVVRQQNESIIVNLDDGFGNAECVVHEAMTIPLAGGNLDSLNKCCLDALARELIIATPGQVSKKIEEDDLLRLPLILAAAMTRKLEANRHKGGRENWLRDTPKALLARLDDEVAELKQAILREPDNVLNEAADVACFAMFIADKADKLEPIPELELIEPE